eukprot:m.275514 g.275514  ORF g.275514 m.275514 type:complete len:394 (-) comp119506_c0_seq1:94-1275(-)
MSQQQQWQESVGGFNLSDLEKMLPAGARLVGTQQLPAGARLVGTQQTVFAMGSTVTESVVPPQRLFTSAHTMPTMSPQTRFKQQANFKGHTVPNRHARSTQHQAKNSSNAASDPSASTASPTLLKKCALKRVVVPLKGNFGQTLSRVTIPVHVDETLSNLPVKILKRMLSERGISYNGFLEKLEYISALKQFYLRFVVLPEEMLLNYTDMRQEIFESLNKTRADPKRLIPLLERHLIGFINNGKLRVAGSKTRARVDGAKGCRDAIEFLRKQKPVRLLRRSGRIDRAAQDHCFDLGPNNKLSHYGVLDNCAPDVRLKRRGFVGSMSEIACAHADETNGDSYIMEFVLDDGNPAFGHRHRVFDATYDCAGVGLGPYVPSSHVCVIDLGGGPNYA